ncbi:MAG: hypothetical protein PF630_10245 [Gammaproteobacteria bacterium]|nr:hypothetical protein [Gammaproteobacteria bacterium]
MHACIVRKSGCYELSNNWNLTLESGQRDSAVQINWRKNSD